MYNDIAVGQAMLYHPPSPFLLDLRLPYIAYQDTSCPQNPTHWQTYFALCAVGVALIWMQPADFDDSCEVPEQLGPVKVKTVHCLPAGMASGMTVMLENLPLKVAQ